MKKNSFSFIALLFVLFFTLNSCEDKNSKAIEEVTNKFYQSNVGKGFSDVNENYFSKALTQKIASAKQTTSKSIQKIKNSPYPTDKPELIEGDIFTSLYEGHTSLKILSISYKKNKASVLIEFTNSNYKTYWKDKVQLVDENGWKIDNVIYGDKTLPSKDVNEVLSSFCNTNQN